MVVLFVVLWDSCREASAGALFDLVIVIKIDMNGRKLLLYFKVGQSVWKFSVKIWHVEEMTLLLKVKLSSNTNFRKRFNFRLCIWIRRRNYGIMYGNYERHCHQVKNNVVGQHRYVQISRWYISYFFRDRSIEISELNGNFDIIIISKLVTQPVAEKIPRITIASVNNCPLPNVRVIP